MNSTPEQVALGGKRRNLAGSLRTIAAKVVQHDDQRALAVDRHATRRTRTETIVEDLQRQQSVEAGLVQRAHEVGDRQFALPGEASVVPAPRQVIHLEFRRVGHLNQKDAIRRNGLDRREIGLARKHVKGIQHQTERLVIGAPHDLPGIAVIVHVPAPRQRLKSHAQAAARGPLGKFAQVGRRPVDAAQRIRRDVAADHQQVAAQFFHHVELALGARERLRTLRFRQALEVAEGLKRHRLEPRAFDEPSGLARRAVERQEVVLEDFDALEPRAGDGLDLLRQAAAQTDRGNRRTHARNSLVPPRCCAVIQWSRSQARVRRHLQRDC